MTTYTDMSAVVLFMNIFLFFILPYLIGSIPCGLLLAKLFGYGDIRKIGSGNIGATNALRTGNKWLAALTLILDGLKGFLPIYAYVILLILTEIVMILIGSAIDAVMPAIRYTYCCAAMPQQVDFQLSFMTVGLVAILGHIFPVWLKFKGGKGVATGIGTLLAIEPILGLSVISLWLVIFTLSRISSLSALAAFAGTTVIASVCAFIFKDHHWAYNAGYLLVVTLLIFATHRSNIARLLKGQEHTWSKSNEPS